jgi:hypothetical protein
MRVLLGDDDVTSLAIAEASATTDATEWSVTTRDGSFTTRGICPVDGGRFVRVAGTFLVRAVAPQPADDHTRVTLVADAPGDVHVSVVDALGRAVATVFDGRLGGGEQEITVDLRDVPDGYHHLVVRSGRHVERVPMIVVKGGPNR